MSYFMCIVRPALNGGRVGLALAGVGYDYSICDQ
jgi:hypothetical protein